MILVDDRVGSRELLHLFQHGSATLYRLEYGDFSFIGNGPDGPVMVGIERKQVREVASTLLDHRFTGHQLPGLLQQYQIVYLIVEGRMRAAPGTGLLEYKRSNGWVQIVNGTRRYMASDIRLFLSTIENTCGVRLRFTESQRGTADEVKALHDWWTGKEWQDHKSHLANRNPLPDTTWVRKPTLVEQIAACLPGVGWKRARAAGLVFPSVQEMVEAVVEDWEKVEGIGKGVAAKVVAAINGNKL